MPERARLTGGATLGFGFSPRFAHLELLRPHCAQTKLHKKLPMYWKTYLRIVALAGLLTFCVAHGLAQANVTYYVSPAGADTNPCSAPQPCRQVPRAVALFQAGTATTILLADGDYDGFNVEAVRGTAAAPLIIKAQGANAVILPRARLLNLIRGNIYILDSTYVVLEGLRTFSGTGSSMAGIAVRVSSHVTVRNCVSGRNSDYGIFSSFADDLLLENNETFGSVVQHGIYVSNSSQRPIIRGNRSHDNAQNGIQINADLSAGLPGTTSGAVLENNIVYNNAQTAINLDGVQDSVVRNNLLYNNRGSGIAAFKQDGAVGPKDVRIYFNTVVMAADGRWAVRVVRSEGPVILRNNILYNQNSARGGISLATTDDSDNNGDVRNIDSDYNLFGGGNAAVTPNDQRTLYTLIDWQAKRQDLHSFTALLTSLFVNAGVSDYHLARNSPAIGKGTDVAGITTDLEGRARKPGSPDLGALESVPPSSPQINPGGTVSAPNFLPRLTAGAIVSVFGSNLASGTVAATTSPLPTTLGGVSVTVGGVSAPLFFVSPGQINFQIPWEMIGRAQAPLRVTADGLAGGPANLDLTGFGPGLFSTNSAGSGQGSVLIAATGEVAAPVGSIPGAATRPAGRGEDISIFCTGLGDVVNRPASGSKPAGNPLSTTVVSPTVTVDNLPAAVSFSGLAPCCVGLYQVNVRVPENTPVSDSVRVVLTIGGVTSNAVTIAVR